MVLTARSAQSLAEGLDVDRRLLAELDSQASDLTIRLEAQAGLYGTELKQLRERRTAAETELERLRSLRAIELERRQLAREDTYSQKRLADRGIVARREYVRVRDDLLAREQELGRLDSRIAERSERIRGLSRELEGAPLRHSARMAELRSRLAELRVQRTDIEARAVFAVKAPVEGVVAALDAAPGATVSAGTPVVTIVPDGAELEAHLFIPSRAVGFVEPGQRVLLKYAAFPYQQFGLQLGEVKELSDAPLLPTETSIPVSLTEPAYRATVRLNEQTVFAYSRSHDLQSGMLLEADLELEARSLLRWILDPLYTLRRGA